jgi:DNA mismatch endonuclease (patch repair protein)
LGRNLNKTRSKDLISKKKRSELMSKIRSTDTKLEKNFIGVLKKTTRQKFYKNVLLIKGKPDIAFLKQKLCVFLDSDFWHGWQYPRWKHLLKDDFWRLKIENNRRRDKKTTIFLRKNGWKVLRIWEHEIKISMSEQINKITKELLN